jgi:uncharacterized membrane protein
MSHTVVFFHVLSAFVWVGGMIAIRVAVHPVLQSIDDPKIKLGKTLEITGRLFHLVIPFILTLLATGLMMAIATKGHHGSLKSLFLSKEIIWTVMTLNFTYMYIQRRAAWKLFEAGRLPEAKAKVSKIPNLLLPVNIVLGIAALFIGVSLRGL